ncbi:hypothetical protein [Methylocella tundrae]|nr:hypothetical protein [Methylocella tundrae]
MADNLKGRSKTGAAQESDPTGLIAAVETLPTEADSGFELK